MAKIKVYKLVGATIGSPDTNFPQPLIKTSGKLTGTKTIVMMRLDKDNSRLLIYLLCPLIMLVSGIALIYTFAQLPEKPKLENNKREFSTIQNVLIEKELLMISKIDRLNTEQQKDISKLRREIKEVSESTGDTTLLGAFVSRQNVTMKTLKIRNNAIKKELELGLEGRENLRQTMDDSANSPQAR